MWWNQEQELAEITNYIIKHIKTAEIKNTRYSDVEYTINVWIKKNNQLKVYERKKRFSKQIAKN